MRPIIGLTPSMSRDEVKLTLNVAHVNAISNAGGLPFVIPYSEKDAIIDQIAESIDGLYVTGGGDIDPHYFKEEPHPALGYVDPVRDFFEMELVKKMIDRNKAVFGVCRGVQIINVALGGTMFQDLNSQKNSSTIQHIQRRSLQHASHFVQIERGSLLFEILQLERIKVNSYHHQANRSLGKYLRASAMSDDGVIEAIELTKSPFVLGVQWHPEQQLKRKDYVARTLYQTFVQRSRQK